MNRTRVTDENGITVGWFDAEKATRFQENTRWDGSNHISKSTGSQWEHQDLYRTKSGKWVLNSWSDYQGSSEEYLLVNDTEAGEWFMRHEYNDSEIPESLMTLLSNYFESTEL